MKKLFTVFSYVKSRGGKVLVKLLPVLFTFFLLLGISLSFLLYEVWQLFQQDTPSYNHFLIQLFLLTLLLPGLYWMLGIRYFYKTMLLVVFEDALPLMKQYLMRWLEKRKGMQKLQNAGDFKLTVILNEWTEKLPKLLKKSIDKLLEQIPFYDIYNEVSSSENRTETVADLVMGKLDEHMRDLLSNEWTAYQLAGIHAINLGVLLYLHY
ncbi:hypothetical protein AAG747_10305 [Rapidithrix thailandica]|uniref:Uncharacterized protein n=1 Tax=Rapidithrix thailandica TaxID=413964 RepID=A0AAW9S971_9BACT